MLHWSSSGFHGLRVGGRLSNSVLAFKPNSGMVDLPMTMTPVERSWVVNSASAFASRAGTDSAP